MGLKPQMFFQRAPRRLDMDHNMNINGNGVCAWRLVRVGDGACLVDIGGTRLNVVELAQSWREARKSEKRVQSFLAVNRVEDLRNRASANAVSGLRVTVTGGYR